jgi:hypothetical protein
MSLLWGEDTAILFTRQPPPTSGSLLHGRFDRWRVPAGWLGHRQVILNIGNNLVPARYSCVSDCGRSSELNGAPTSARPPPVCA